MDDLFGDLPPPSSSGLTAVKTTQGALDSAPSLFDDLPPESKKLEGGAGEGQGVGLGKRKPSSSVNEDQQSTKQPRLSRFRLKGYIGERRGEREDMQDAHTIIEDFTPQFSSLPNNISQAAYYGVFDGHAGPRASEYTAQHLHKNILAKFPKGNLQNLDREVIKCLVESFKKTDKDFLQKASEAKPSWKDGSTVAAILALDDTLYASNLGDSKAVLCRRSPEGKLSLIHLTKDHNPSNFEERKRIEKAGGVVRDGRVMGIVEVSRSIGDGKFKRCGIIATPNILRSTLTENDLFILIACDGLWKVFSAEEAARFIISILEDDNIKISEDDCVDTNFESNKPSSLRDVRYEEACNQLAVEAVKRGCTDNVTVMIVDILTQIADSDQSRVTSS